MPSERPKVVLVTRCFPLDPDGDRILFIRRADTDNWFPGQWECPGGKLEEGQDVSHALEEEVFQETGLLVTPVSRVATVESFIITRGPYVGLPYVCLFGVGKVTGGTVRLSSEHSAHQWVTYQEALDLELRSEVRKAFIVLRNHFE
jgi:8-oxo-dGTP pyrophosphatase MutT (NUDIX family)